MMVMKQVIVVRKDLGMGKGKVAAQVAHASFGAARSATSKNMEDWESSGSKKVVLKTEGGQEDLIELQKEAKREGLATFLVKDAGKTQLEPGTITALGIGPNEDGEIDKIVGHLKLL